MYLRLGERCDVISKHTAPRNVDVYTVYNNICYQYLITPITYKQHAIWNIRYIFLQSKFSPPCSKHINNNLPASKDLHDAFNTLVSSPTQRGLLATIEKESLIPGPTIPLSSTFSSDLSSLAPHLTPQSAAYILLKLDGDASDGYVAVTYVPDTAPVRQKMLFASTRLTLVRELGVERFRETIFVTRAEELSAEGWKKHEAHTKLEAPLTEEEEGLKGIKEAEAQESGGTGARKRIGGGGIGLEAGDDVLKALEGLKGGSEGELVMVVSCC